MFRPGEKPPKPRQPELEIGLGETLPTAAPAQLKKRHRGLFWAFLFFVLVPVGLVAAYLFEIAEDQYASTTGFTVRQEEGGSATDLLGGFDLFSGTGGSSDADILYEYIQSQKIVERIDARLDLRSHYVQHWDTDKVFSLWPDATIEDLLWYWKRFVRINYDQSAGLIELEVRAFDPDFAQALAIEIVTESQAMINQLSAAAREDATRYAQADLDEALARLKSAREALTAYRTRSQIVDPEADIQGRMGVMNNLQQQLAEALIEFDLISQTSNQNDPRITQAARRIEVIRARIASEREAFALGADDVGALTEDYPTLIAEFESLAVDREYAEQAYTAALTALDVARAKANRLSRYLATYVEPTLAEEAEYPQRYILTALMALFLVLFWGIFSLVYYSIRDRR